MDWKLHAEAFYAEWIVKYLQPPKSAWKDLLDQFIVFDKRGIQKFSTARSAVLNPDSRLRYIQGLPKKAKYIRRCFMAFWKMGIKQDMTYTDGLKGESIWNNPRAPVSSNPDTRERLSTFAPRSTWNYTETSRTGIRTYPALKGSGKIA